MKRSDKIHNFLKILIIIFSVCFLLTACNGSESSSNSGTGSETLSVTPMNSDGAGSKSPSELAQEQRQCWQSGILEIMYEQMGAISLGLYKEMTTGALTLMMVAFSVWFSFRLLKHLGSFQEENVAEVWKEVLKQLFLCFVCGILASSDSGLIFILNKVIFPIYYAFLEFAGEMLNAAGTSEESGVTNFPFLGEILKYGEPVRCVPEQLVTSDALDSFPQAPIDMMKCIACAINERLSIGFSLSFKTLFDNGIFAFLLGLGIFLIFTFIKISFVFYLVDTLFRFTIVVTILPALILAYAFKQTRSWANFGFVTMLNSAAYMMFVAIMIAVALLAMEEIMKSPALGLTSSDINEVSQSFKELSIPFLCLLLLAFLIVSTMTIAAELTDTFVGGDSSANFQKRAGKAGAMLLKFFAVRFFKSGVKVAGKVAGKVTKKT